jgi:hypothetical protein
MRRSCLGPLVLLAACTALAGSARFARGDALPYAGAWEVKILENGSELSVWLVEFDKEGKKAGVISGYRAFARSRLSGLKADASGVRFHLKAATPQGDQEFDVTARVPPGKDKGRMLGTVRAGTNFVPVRVEKSDRTEIDARKARRPMEGLPELVKAAGPADPAEKIKQLEDFLKRYPGKPIVFTAGSLLAAERIKAKAPADAFRPMAAAYVQAAAAYGREMRVQAHLDLARMLLGYDPTAALALAHAEKAAALLEDGDDRGVRLTVLLQLAAALAKNGKKDRVVAVLPKITAITDDVIRKPRGAASPLQVTRDAAVVLLGSAAAAVREAGLAYARKAVALLGEKTPLAEQVSTRRLLQNALAACDRLAEAKGMEPALDRMEDQLDGEYLKTAIPFKPDKYAGRKGKGDRVVLVEAFTSANAVQPLACAPALDALAATYPPKEVLVLQYHLATPSERPNVFVYSSLCCPGAEARKKFYEDDIPGLPTTFLDGKATPALGGARVHAKARYDTLRGLIDKELERPAGAKLGLTAARVGDRIDVSARVSGLPAAAGPVRLFFVLAEGRVRYVGTNGVRLHHDVVREVTAGVKVPPKPGAYNASIDLAGLRKKINAHLDAAQAKGPFPNRARPMGLKKLKVVALLQDEDTKRVLQAAAVEVEEKK